MESQYLPKVIFLPLKLVLLVACVLAKDNIRVSMEAHISVHNKTLLAYKVEPLLDSSCIVGEGPHWDIETQSLYFVDILNGRILRYDFNQDLLYKCKIENASYASFVIPIEGATDQFIVGIGRNVAIVTWDGISETCKADKIILTVEQDEKYNNNRFNDAKCDPHGRLFAGTMNMGTFGTKTGNLYRLDENGEKKIFENEVGVSNGLAWNETANKFYYIDTADHEVKEFDYDITSGEIKNPKVLFNLRNLRGDNVNLLPDGMTIDSEGHLYVATFGGSSLFKIDPNDGKVLLEIKMPCEQVTSAAFGGPNLDILFVTTASENDKPAPAGTTYKITGLGSKGLPMMKFKLENQTSKVMQDA